MRTRFALRVCVATVSAGALLFSAAAPAAAAPGPSDGVKKMLRQMTLREKVGQLFVV